MIKLLSLQANNFKQLQDVNLRFPPCGSVLIEGRNEAGKSTLFEAIFFALFGKPLLAGTTAEDLIGYQASEAIVLLEVTYPSGRFLIQRKVRKSKTRASAEARLRVYDADGTDVEEIRGASAVNERIQQELKLDADAFLNSCFVEQKKLEKLEGMTAADREKSLMRLLNMDRMLDTERALRITLDDSRRLQRLDQRVRLAEVMGEIPGVMKQGRECKMALDIIALKDRLAVIERCAATAADAERRLTALEAPIRELETRVARIDTVRSAAASAQIMGVRLGAIEQQTRDIERHRARLAELDDIAARQLPALRERLARTKRLRGRWSRLISLEAEAERAESEAGVLRRRLEEAEAARQSVEEMERRVREQTEHIRKLESEERQLAVTERASGVRQSLEDWLAAAAARDGVETISRQAADAEAEAAATDRRLQDASLSAAIRRRAVTSSNARVVTPLIGAAILAWFSREAGPILLGFALLMLVIAGVCYFDRRKRVVALLRAEDEEARLAEALREALNASVRLEGQMENARATSGAAAGRLEQANAKLEALEETLPGTPADAEARLDALPAAGEAFDSERLAEVRRGMAQAQGAVEEQRRAITAQRAVVDAANVSVLKASAERLEARATRIREGIVGPWTEFARETSASLSLDAGDAPGAAREAAAAAEAGVAEQIRLTERSLTERSGIERRVSETEAGIAAERDELRAAWPPITAVRPDEAAPETAEAAASLRSGLAEELEALDEPSVLAELRARREEWNAATNDRTVAQRESATAEAELRRGATVLKYPHDAPLTPEGLAGALPQWNSADPAQRDELTVRFEELKDRNAALGGRRDDLAEALGIDPKAEKLDLEKERAQYEDVARDHGVREKAIAILRNARDRIMGKVLPYTIEHMRRILPALTMERYHDAKLTSDYKIEVWDERASMWKAKNIFSGGTRDQLSLALRLAFAVATLPQERGAAPGFIFLDEPLSSFDVERSAALMYLLTKGEIAEAFDQILVISHSQTIAADDFQYRLKLDAGRIEEAPEEMRAAPAQMELAAVGE